MKALSLWQPWASLIAHGLKEFETRSWGTNYRGPLYIHAAARRNMRDERRVLQEMWLAWRAIGRDTAPLEALGLLAGLPRGCLVAQCALVGCLVTDGTVPSLREGTMGNFAPGRFAWKLAAVRRLETPLPVKGQQGLFDLPRLPDE